MNRANRKFVQLALAAAVGAACLLVNEKAPVKNQSSLVSTADAIIGRPLTPMSYAGVARRTTRRAVAVGAVAAPVVVAPVVAAPVVIAPRCVQAVDAYGRLYTRCY